MLEDLSAHVLDIAENSTRAGATEIEITIEESAEKDLLLFAVKDNGRGMSPEFVAKVTDPFTTTRTTRRVGMGLPFLRQSAELCGGALTIDSTVGVGTTVTATFGLSCVDRPPLGDMPSTMMTLVMGAPLVHWKYRHVGRPLAARQPARRARGSRFGKLTEARGARKNGWRPARHLFFFISRL